MKVIVSWITEEDEQAFRDRFALYPDIVVRNARTETVDLVDIDALLLTGGCDVGQPFLRQPVPDVSLVRNDEPGRDEWEFAAVAEARERSWPIFAICRGLQVLNVALGGTLHLDIPGHTKPTHQNVQPLAYVSGVPNLFTGVNSEHHQALNVVAPPLVVEARNPVDGVVEQVRAETGPWTFGVQYHPERDASYQTLFDDFVAALRQRAAIT
ncbi:MAG TPA: gamma-glutamyl-gamma-aminobutyrate hydrolase family protein [Chthoniobacterales bacterium]